MSNSLAFSFWLPVPLALCGDCHLFTLIFGAFSKRNPLYFGAPFRHFFCCCPLEAFCQTKWKCPNKGLEMGLAGLDWDWDWGVNFLSAAQLFDTWNWVLWCNCILFEPQVGKQVKQKPQIPRPLLSCIDPAYSWIYIPTLLYIFP